MFRVLIDDLRTEANIGLPLDIILRNSKAVYHSVSVLMNTYELFLDNDMGPESDEGWEIIKEVLSFGVRIPEITVVTQNPVAGRRIKNIIMDTGDYTEVIGGRVFKLNKVSGEVGSIPDGPTIFKLR